MQFKRDDIVVNKLTGKEFTFLYYEGVDEKVSLVEDSSKSNVKTMITMLSSYLKKKNPTLLELELRPHPSELSEIKKQIIDYPTREMDEEIRRLCLTSKKYAKSLYKEGRKLLPSLSF